jgi:hypothetical protein
MRTGKAVRCASLIVVLLAAIPCAALAADRGWMVNVTGAYREVKSHFYDYNAGNSYNTWETQKLTGARAELLIPFSHAEKRQFMAGLGVGAYSVGAYDYEVRIYSGEGPSGGVGMDAELTLQGNFALSQKADLLLRLGGSYLQVGASGDAALPAPYDDDFSQGYPDLYAGGGLQLDLSEKMTALVTARFSLVDLGSWTDYGADPSNEGASNWGFQAGIGFRL